jgi:hypothetical protein
MVLFPYISSMYILNEVGYNYRWGGMTSKYNPVFMQESLILYYKKKSLIRIYDYHKATSYICIEMKNNLFVAISQMIYYKWGSKKEILQEIEKILTEPCFDDVIEYYRQTADSNCFVKALVNRDIQLLYEIAKKDVGKNFFRKKLSRLIFNSLSKL